MSEHRRKLASIQRIESLVDIPNSDTLSVAKMYDLGWYCVVKKGQFNKEDDIVFFEIDSFIPDTKYEFEFLRKSCFKEYPDGRRGYRIKTIRLRGQISQGLIMPISILPRSRYTIGQDVSELLGITKWEPPMPKCLSGKAKGTFPGFLVKTDETRVQVLQSVLSRYVGLPCYITEKIDGSSVTYYIKDGIFGICSRNLELKLDDEENNKTNAYIKWAIENNIEQKLRKKNKNIAIQGEIYGNSICGNNLQLSGHDVRFFNVFDIDRCKFFDYHDFVKFIESMELKTVPILYTNFKLIDNIDELVKMSIGKSIINPNVMREGIVIRPLKEIMDLGMSVSGFGNTGRLSFKVISPEYLLVEKDE